MSGTRPSMRCERAFPRAVWLFVFASLFLVKTEGYSSCASSLEDILRASGNLSILLNNSLYSKDSHRIGAAIEAFPTQTISHLLLVSRDESEIFRTRLYALQRLYAGLKDGAKPSIQLRRNIVALAENDILQYLQTLSDRLHDSPAADSALRKLSLLRTSAYQNAGNQSPTYKKLLSSLGPPGPDVFQLAYESLKVIGLMDSKALLRSVTAIRDLYVILKSDMLNVSPTKREQMLAHIEGLIDPITSNELRPRDAARVLQVFASDRRSIRLANEFGDRQVSKSKLTTLRQEPQTTQTDWDFSVDLINREFPSYFRDEMAKSDGLLTNEHFHLLRESEKLASIRLLKTEQDGFLELAQRINAVLENSKGRAISRESAYSLWGDRRELFWRNTESTVFPPELVSSLVRILIRLVEEVEKMPFETYNRRIGPPSETPSAFLILNGFLESINRREMSRRQILESPEVFLPFSRIAQSEEKMVRRGRGVWSGTTYGVCIVQGARQLLGIE